MSLTPPDILKPIDRRQHPRIEPRELTYVDLGPDNGGLLVNISEGGLGFEGILHLRDAQIVPVEFKLRGTNITIRATCQYARTDDPGRSGGLRFIDLTAEARQEIREWVAAMSGRQGESRGAAEAADAAAAKATIESDDSSATVQEPQATVASPEPNSVSAVSAFVVPVAPLALPATATPRAESNAAPSNAAAHRVQHSVSQAATLRTTHLQSERPLQPMLSSADAIGSPKSVAAAPLNGPAIWPAPTYKEKTAANEKKTGGTAREQLNFGAQALQFASGAAVGCLGMIVIAGALLWAGYLHLPSAVASRTSTEQNATGPSSPNFQVEIVNLNNQRWMLPIGAGNNTQPSQTPAPTHTAPAQSAATVAPRATAPNAKAPGARSGAATSARLALQLPRATGGTRDTASLQAPSLFDGITPPLPSPLPYVASSASVPVPASAFPSPEPLAAPPLPTGVSASPQPETGSPSAGKAFPAVRESVKPARPMNFRPAELTQRFDPVYPPLARQQHVQGSAQVSATIGKDGIPRGLKAVSGDPRFTAAAITAIIQWRYKPAMLDGQAVESELVITINFQF